MLGHPDSGGAGTREHFLDVFTRGHADAALAASIFHDGQHTVEFDVSLQPGVNRLDLVSPQPGLRATQGRNQLRTFGIHEVTLTLPNSPYVAQRE